jgi:hypothetical protein
VVDKALGRTVLPADVEKLPQYLTEFKKRSDISHELADNSFSISRLDQFPGFPAVPLRGATTGLEPTIGFDA